jgi:glutamate/tyrosine decarboxylase-like PLP-dependent enzyme
MVDAINKRKGSGTWRIMMAHAPCDIRTGHGPRINIILQLDPISSRGEIVLEKLEELERVSRQLEPDQGEREGMLDEVRAYAESFLKNLPTARAYTKDEGRGGTSISSFEEAPTNLPALLELLRREVDTAGINPVSAGMLGYIPGGGLYPSALGDYLADVYNRYSGVSFANPGAAELELSLVRWMCQLVGYPETAGGDLTSGGSMATLSALVTARDAYGIDPDKISGACIYLTGQAHHCIGKALHVAGLKDIRKRFVPMDNRFRMDVIELKKMIDSDRDQGLKPWLVVASAGTTDTGAVDPIPEIAQVAQLHGLWFHLDAAYGGFFMLCEEGRERLHGLDQADSIILDPHKGLGLPYGSGAVLIKDLRLLAESNRFYADYMQDAKHADYDPDAVISPSDLSLELTRPFRGPRMWLPLKIFGLRSFRASLAEKIWLARYFHQELSKLEGFETGPDPDLSIVTYRYQPKAGDANAFNKRLQEAVLEDGRVFTTSTMIAGKYTLRLAVLNFRTHRETIDYLLELLQRKARELENT